jgi:hypothetical protein
VQTLALTDLTASRGSALGLVNEAAGVSQEDLGRSPTYGGALPAARATFPGPNSRYVIAPPSLRCCFSVAV